MSAIWAHVPVKLGPVTIIRYIGPLVWGVLFCAKKRACFLERSFPIWFVHLTGRGGGGVFYATYIIYEY